MRRLRWGAALTVTTLALAGSAQAADETRMELVDATHANAVPDSTLAPPLRRRWQADIGTPVSNVVVADGRVAYVRAPGTGSVLTVLDLATGRLIWERTLPAGSTHQASLASDGGRLLLARDGQSEYPAGVAVEAIAPATGATIWQRSLPAEYGLGSGLTADGGQVFLLASSGETRLHGLRLSDGADLWAPKGITSGSDSTPTLDGSSVYVSVAGPQVYAFDRGTGAERWHYAGCCTGGGGSTSALHAGQLYGHDALVHSAATGAVVGSFSGARPAFVGDGGVQVAQGGGLRAFGPDFGTTRWTVPNDTGSDGATLPLVAGPTVFSSAGPVLFGARLGDGSLAWCARLTLPPGSPTTSGSGIAVRAAGGGALLVSVGYGLAAFESGGSTSDCAPAAGTPGPGAGTGSPGPTAPTATASAAGPALTLTAGKRDLVLGERTRLRGVLSGLPQVAGLVVALDADPWPFDGRFTQTVRTRTTRAGGFAFLAAPSRNRRYRVRLARDPRVVSPAVDLFPDFPFRTRVLGRGSATPRIVVTIGAFPGARLRRQRAHAYLTRGRTAPYRLVSRRRAQRRDKRSVTFVLPFPRGRLTRADRWVICLPEPTPDSIGRPSELERRCGAPTLPRGLS